MVEIAGELVKQVSESRAQAAIDATPATQSAVKTEIVSLSANLKKAREEAFSTEAESEAHGVRRS